MVEDKETFKPTINNEEKTCFVCLMPEKDALSNGIKFVRMDSLYDKKFCEYIGVDLSQSSIIKDSYVCSKCVDNANTLIKEIINKNKCNIKEELEEIHEKVDSFTDYVLTGAYLFKLDNTIIVQSGFNVFNAALENMIEDSPKFAKHVIKTSLIELERKLQELEKIC